MTTRTKVSTPELYGWPLIAAANALEMLPFVANKIARDGAMLDLRDCNDIDEIPTTLALPENYILNNNKATSAPTAIPKLQEETKSRSHYLSFWDYHDAYMHKKTTPTQVAKNLIAAVEAHQKYHWIRSYSKEQILKQAEASTLRYELGQPLSQLDGVFIPVKEELDVVGLETKFGTSFINDGKPATENATLVQRLMNAGVIILGHTVMNELGWDTFTVNPATGMPANPFDISSSCGGSSGGSAGVVASGIVPVAIGCDGGGSVRIPASFCGLYGLKTTTGRVSSVGGRPVDPTVSVSGPIAATADDMALTYAVMSGVDEKDPRTRFQPVMSLENYTLTHTLEGMTIGITKTFNDLVEEPAIMDQMTHFMRYFESLGAKIVEIDIPDLAMVRTAHIITICSEMFNFASRYPSQRRQFCAHTRIMSAVSHCLDGRDYTRSQQVRTRIMNYLEHLFDNQKVDLILTPMTPIVAPEIPAKAHQFGMNNTTLTMQSMHYTYLANLAGTPAVSIPTGYHNGKPTALQFIGRWFDEALLCRMAKICELAPGVERSKPSLWYDGPL